MAILLNRGNSRAPLCQCCFRQQKLKLLSMSAHGTQRMTDTYSSVQRRYNFFTLPFQLADRLCCDGWHKRAAPQSLDQIPVTDQCQANTILKLLVCREAICTICSANCTICRVSSDLYSYSTTQHRRRAMLVGMDAIFVQHVHALTCSVNF